MPVSYVNASEFYSFPMVQETDGLQAVGFPWSCSGLHVSLDSGSDVMDLKLTTQLSNSTADMLKQATQPAQSADAKGYASRMPGGEWLCTCNLWCTELGAIIAKGVRRMPSSA